MDSLINFSISSTAFEKIEDAIAYCANNSLNIEITKFINPLILENITKKDLDKLKNLLTDQGVNRRSYHGAFFDLNPTSLDPKIVEITTDRIKKSIDIAKYLNVETIVFHSGYNSLIKLEVYKTRFIEKQIEFWKNFIRDNDIDGITITLENTYEEDPYIVKQMIEGIGCKSFKSCIDTGHVNAFSTLGLTKWLEVLEPYLHHFHIHNNFADADTHCNLSNGTINFREFFCDIKKLNKKLSLSLEMFDPNDVYKSMEFIKQQF